MESNTASNILDFLEHVGNHHEGKAKALISDVKKELEVIKGEDNHPNGKLKEHIEKLEKMIKNIKAKKFEEARKDHVKVKNGLKTHISRKNKEKKEVKELPENRGSPPKRTGSRASNKGSSNKRTESAKSGIDEQRISKNEDVKQFAIKGAHMNPIKKAGANKKAKQNEALPTVRESSRNDFDEKPHTTERPYSQHSMHTDPPKSHINDTEPLAETKGATHEDNTNLNDSHDRKDFIERICANNPGQIKLKFENLYDNEWADAYGVLQQRDHMPERDITRKLLAVLEDVYGFCENEVQRKLEEIVLAMKRIILLQHGKVPVSARGERQQSVTGDVDLVKQYCSLHSDVSRDHLFSKYTKIRDGKLISLQHKDMVSYVKKCIEVTWLMCLQDPPIVLHPTDGYIPELYHDNPSKKDKYQYDFIVRPALMYGKHLLGKGDVRYKRV